MASHEKRCRQYRIAFRHGGTQHHVSMKATDSRDAESCRNRSEENLRRVERGRLSIPEGANDGLFLLSEGKMGRPVEIKNVPSLNGMIEHYREAFAEGAKELNTRRTDSIHLKHLERVIGGSTATALRA